MIRLFVAGEGPNEIGESGSPLELEGERSSGAGVIEALVAKVRPGGWQICALVTWRDIPKLRVNVHGDGDERTVRALALRAREKGCHALLFLRDRDRQVSRGRSIRNVVAQEEARNPALQICAGIPVETLECWLLALAGEELSETNVDCAATLHDRHGVQPKRTSAMVHLVRNSDLRDSASDAHSLRDWLQGVSRLLGVPIPASRGRSIAE